MTWTPIKNFLFSVLHLFQVANFRLNDWFIEWPYGVLRLIGSILAIKWRANLWKKGVCTFDTHASFSGLQSILEPLLFINTFYFGLGGGLGWFVPYIPPIPTNLQSLNPGVGFNFNCTHVLFNKFQIF